MSTDPWGERERALEESFFFKKDQELMGKLKHDLATAEKKKSLSQVSGIVDEALLDELVAVDISGESVAALTLVPLVVVAWADGKMEDEERRAILKAADAEGIASGSVSYQLLEQWLHNQPGEELATAWKDYVHMLAQRLGAKALATFKADVLGRARSVAQAAGGILGMNTVSQSEQNALKDLESAFSS